MTDHVDLACHQECPIGLSLRSTYPWTDAKMAGDGRVRLRKHHFSGVLAWWPGSAGISSVVANNTAICRPTFGGGISHHQMWVHPRPPHGLRWDLASNLKYQQTFANRDSGVLARVSIQVNRAFYQAQVQLICNYRWKVEK